jgi:hypothetical protein
MIFVATDYTDKIRIFYPPNLWLNDPMTVCALGLMAKAPVAGGVKTRLVPPLTALEAAALSICFLRDMAANIQSVSDTEAASGLVVYTPAGAASAFASVLPAGFELLVQRGSSLGERLYNAIDDLLKQGYGAVCLINSDSPNTEIDPDSSNRVARDQRRSSGVGRRGRRRLLSNRLEGSAQESFQRNCLEHLGRARTHTTTRSRNRFTG